jgi:hypothetical protein
VKFISYRKSVKSHSQMKDLNKTDPRTSSISVKRSSYDLDFPVLLAITQAYQLASCRKFFKTNSVIFPVLPAFLRCLGGSGEEGLLEISADDEGISSILSNRLFSSCVWRCCCKGISLTSVVILLFFSIVSLFPWPCCWVSRQDLPIS